MKIFKLLMIAMLCMTTPALAEDKIEVIVSYDFSYVGPIKAKESQSVKVHLPAGKSKIEAWTPSSKTPEVYGKVSCQFATSMYGITVEQSDTHKCDLQAISKDPTDITVTLSNLENKDTDYRIWVHGPN